MKDLVSEVDLIDSDDDYLRRISEEMGLGLSVDELRIIEDYFKERGRNPTDIELQSLAQAWSEHCCYKSSKTLLKRYILIDAFENVPFSSLQIKDLQPPQNILMGEDAGILEFNDEYAYAVAFESHNHPSNIEPYGGAATGIGGIVRDVVCMGATPVALVDPLFFDPLKGIKSKFLLNGVVSGISDYGNRIGVPTVSGMVYFDEDYVSNCLVNVGCVGIVKKSEIIRSRAKEGDLFILVGGRTGRDGIHGVTFASAELSEKSEEDRGAVQLGDPITKEPLIHACLEANERGLLDGMKDLGGGGLSCVIGEMALAGGCGAEIELENVPLKEEGLKPWEILVSESQERMMLSVDPKNLREVFCIFEGWDLLATVIGRATKRGFLKSNIIMKRSMRSI
ncbi:MAG: phosphoribosylformylglycinamidine synthase II [Candidatus Methanolliviera sp. GoM_asphalt]|nr:MAG: phosphoribosylformylglycinamidine synthase II [Candidatus Methanolliviera sp. GoM_asphalt]